MLHFLGIQKLLSSSSSTQFKKILTIKKPEENNYKNKQKTLVVEYRKKYRYMLVSNWCLDKKKLLSEKCEYANEQFGKAHCLMIVHSGINKNLLNEDIFDTYDVSVKGMENQYLFNLQCFKHDCESKNVTTPLQQPIRIGLNKDTIYDCVTAIIKAYKNSQDLSYTKISDSLFWGFSHDSITKFAMELLGILIQWNLSLHQNVFYKLMVVILL